MTVPPTDGADGGPVPADSEPDVSDDRPDVANGEPDVSDGEPVVRNGEPVAPDGGTAAGATEAPEVGDRAPDFEALLCDGETFRSARLADVLGPRGGVVVFFGFVASAIARNWWKRYDRYGWDEFDAVPVLGVTRDGPYAHNAFLRAVDSPFRTFSDVDGKAIEAYGLSTEREGMAGASTARRAVFVLAPDRTVRYRWVADDWISPVPADGVAEAVADLG